MGVQREENVKKYYTKLDENLYRTKLICYEQQETSQQANFCKRKRDTGPNIWLSFS
jgi:hypothetical protein